MFLKIQNLHWVEVACQLFIIPSVSLTMQQGDCNAPSTFQRLMTVVFHDYIAYFVHVYLDNIFIYSSSIEEHKKHLELVFNKLHEAQLYLSQDKVDLYSQRMDCLGHIISDVGISCKISWIGNNPTTITSSRDFLDSFNIWHISCQILPHTRCPYRRVSIMGNHLYGPTSRQVFGVYQNTHLQGSDTEAY